MKRQVVRLFQKRIIYILFFSLLLHGNAGLIVALEHPTIEKTIQAAALQSIKASASKHTELEKIIAFFQEAAEKIAHDYCSFDQIKQIYTELYQFKNELIAIRSKHGSLMLPDFQAAITADNTISLIQEICLELNAFNAVSDHGSEELDDVLYRAMCVQNRIVIILTIVQAIESKLDACCATLSSMIDNISINTSCDFSTVFTALNACCTTLESTIDNISINASCDFSTIFTALQQVDNDVLIVSSKIDSLSNTVAVDFNGTFTALEACCSTLESMIDNISINTSCDFSTVFTALNACCTTLESLIDTISINASCDFSTIFTALQKVDNDVLAVSSKIDSLSNTVAVDFNGTFTALDACCVMLNSQADVMLSKLAIIDTNIDILLGDFQQTWTILEALNFTLNSRLDIISTDLIGCCTAIGSTSDISVGCEVLTTTAAIDAANLSVISWLKTIYRDMRGFSSCN